MLSHITHFKSLLQIGTLGWVGILAAHVAAAPAAPPMPSGDWIALFDGRSLDGWQAGENPASFQVVDGQIAGDGPRAHLFYAGKVNQADFKNFEFSADVRTQPGANSGIYFHTAYQAKGFPFRGFEVQVCNTHEGSGGYRELKKTGSLNRIRNQYKTLVQDDP